VTLAHTAEDHAVVEAQLGRRPRGRWAVAARCHLGVVMVIENHPRLEDGRPFPTLFWLTCPVLVKRASRLEAAGRMSDINGRLQRDEAFTRRLERATARYAARRDSHESLEEDDGLPGGGPERVKCLHAHVAHELADPPNPVGGLTLASTGFPDCRSACVVSGR
jgi:hypothetical protein